MGEVMVVKSKDKDECDEADKAQVILQLQPIPVGYVAKILPTGMPNLEHLVLVLGNKTKAVIYAD